MGWKRILTACAVAAAGASLVMGSAAFAVDEPKSPLVLDMSTDVLPLVECANRLQPVEFDPQVHEYCAFAYYHTDTVSVRAAVADGAALTINGIGADDNGRVSNIDVSDGATISVVATNGESTEEYALTVAKLNTDYRGNEILPAHVSVHGPHSGEDSALVDGDLATSVRLTDIQRAPRKMWSETEMSEGTTGIVIRLDEPRWVHRVNAWASIDQWAETLAPGQPKHWWEGDALNIAVRASDNEDFTVVAKHATFRQDAGGLLYWDFGEYKHVKEIQIWFSNQKDSAEFGPMQGSEYSLSEVEVWGLPDGRAPDTSVDHASYSERYTGFDPSAVEDQWGVNRAQALAMQYGIMLPAWMPSDGYARGTINGEEIGKAGGLFPAFYDNTNLGPQDYLSGYVKGDSVKDQGIFNQTLMETLGEHTPWAIAKAPVAGNSISSAGAPFDFLSDSMRKYADSLVDIQYGDEGDWSQQEQDAFEQWFDWTKSTYPGAVVHSNQASNQGWYNLDTLRSYVQQTQPDLISWDRYYYTTSGKWGIDYQPDDPATMIPHILSSRGPVADMATQLRNYRQVASEGLTGDGSQPIMWGQYLDYMFDANVSDSQKSVIPMVSMAAGAKWFGLFRMEMNGYDYSSLFDIDGAPRREFYEWARVFEDIRGYGDYLSALNNAFLTIKAGDYTSRSGNETAVEAGYHLADFGSAAERQAAARYGIDGVDVSHRGTVNDGRPGDVVLGYFDVLPGLTPSKQTEVFGASDEPVRAVMVVNGLVGTTDTTETRAVAGGQVDRAKNPLARRTDNGSYAQTAQDISVAVTRPYDDAQLVIVDPHTYQPHTVDVQYNAHGRGTVTLRGVGGGQARLLYWVSRSAPTAEMPSDDATVNTSDGSNGASTHMHGQPQTTQHSNRRNDRDCAATTRADVVNRNTQHSPSCEDRAIDTLPRTGSSTQVGLVVALSVASMGGALLALRRAAERQGNGVRSQA
ncbi:MAG: cadherin-like beta sandwich domain-containing protein [Actinomycetaceae bacterium]|nr:cadherin-like beta sandwich domain-containing protein [Arcanobacterium sp.]MDD7505149.1 cadherin-like beta sandwich domain-containing protein [Actinomycetaceae bacterium]MDY6143861.1 cadherin-like beta sandwich domain-containing protein [Arcanobacterium sp.]